MVQKKRAVLGLSGGVDSACAALLLAQSGFEVTGVYLARTPDDQGGPARTAARELGIGFERVDMSRRMCAEVTQPFARAYARGETPSPCIDCNERVKFALLFERADALGAGVVATGHYARVRRLQNGVFGLFRAGAKNDQAYMLYRLSQQRLSRLVFPLGEAEDKSEVREKARGMGLSSAESPDSMEICFVPDGQYARYVESCGYAPPPGDFVDEAGRVLGRHRGIHHYTVGQRRGLGVAHTSRLYVKRIDADKNLVVLSETDPHRSEIALRELFMTAPEYDALLEFEALVQVRHGRTAYPARVVREGPERARVFFERPARAPAPGQSAVFFTPQGRVLGGGKIV